MGCSLGPTSISAIDKAIVFHDAANARSYPGTGVTALNLITGIGVTGILTNGVTFSSASKGEFIFNGSNQYINLSNPSNVQISSGSISVWVKSSSPGSSYRGIIAKQFAFGIFYNNGVLVVYDWGANAERSSSVNIADGNWKHIVHNFQGGVSNGSTLYINGVLVSSFIMGISSNTANLYAGAEVGANQYANCSIANYTLYSRILSQTEITQIYNSMKSRFGLT